MAAVFMNMLWGERPERQTWSTNLVNRLDRSLISDLPAFAGLDAAALETIMREARSLRVEKEATIFEQDEEAASFFVLLDGRVRVVKTTPDGQQVVMRYIVPGEL